MERPPAPEPAPYGVVSILLGAGILAVVFGVVAWMAMQPTVMFELDAPAAFDVELDGRPLLKCEHELDPKAECDRKRTEGIRQYRWPIRPGKDTQLVIVTPEGVRHEETLSAPADGTMKKVATLSGGALTVQ